MVKHAVIAIVYFDDKVLIGKKRSDSKKLFAGQWHIPGETLRNGESDEEALRRGLRQEAGLEDITIGKYVATHKTPTGKEARWYECFSTTDKITPGSDLEDAKWVPKKEVSRSCSPLATSLWPDEIRAYFY